MPVLQHKLLLDRCPHCGVNRPNLELVHGFDTHDHAEMNQRRWCVYVCNNCGGVVTAAAKQFNIPAKEIYPSSRKVEDAIPEKAREYLRQSIDSIHAPAGAVMLAASSVDAMLKEKNYTEGSLYIFRQSGTFIKN
jgi:hypothetical protein